MRKFLLGAGCVLWGMTLTSFAAMNTEKVSVSAMKVYEKIYHTLVQNTSNSQTPGYKEIVSYPFYNGVTMNVNFQTRFDTGPLQRTQNPLDLAIKFDGFFVFLDPSGRRMYSRDGRFTISSKGQLVSMAGNFPVIGESGPIMISGLKVDITEDGSIFEDGVVSNRLKIVKIENLKELERLSGAFFALPPESKTVEIPVTEPSLLSGFVEGSNVNIINGLVDLPTNQRKYDANSKALQIIGRAGKAAREMGNP
jgi:flagellar basal-body rod protein FlgG